jgi:ketosteroid isomerase-like protein
MRPVLAFVLAGCASTSTSSSTVNLETDVKAAAKAFDAAQLAKDRATLERFLAPDMIFVRGSGKRTGRDDFLATFTDPALELAPFVITNPVFVPLGDRAALVGGEAVMSGKERGTPFTEHFRYADIFAWRDGRWQCVYAQVTMIPRSD